MFRNYLRLKIGGNPLEDGEHGAIINPLEIAEVYIHVHSAEFRPGMYREMAFAKTDHARETAGIKIMVNFT